MDTEKDFQKVSVIVPAYNEAERIRGVLSILTTYNGFMDIIVVDDGSLDDTSDIVQGYKTVKYLRHKVNQGKGAAMDFGVQHARGDILLFVDADVRGLTHNIINTILTPVVDGRVDMFIAMRNRKIYFLRFAMIFTPLLGGERALSKKLWEQLPEYYKHRFRVEAGLNFYAKYYGKGFEYKVVSGLHQVIKEKKYGVWDGFVQRVRMFGNIFGAQFHLQFIDIPKSARNKRLLRLVSLQSFFGIILGFFLLLSAYFGPFHLFSLVFGTAWQADPSAVLRHWIITVLTTVTHGTLWMFGGTIFCINLLTLILTCWEFRNLRQLARSHLVKESS